MNVIEDAHHWSASIKFVLEEKEPAEATRSLPYQNEKDELWLTIITMECQLSRTQQITPF